MELGLSLSLTGGCVLARPSITVPTPMPYAWTNAEAQALYARNVGIAPTDARKNLLDSCIGALKAAGVWAKLDVLQVYAAASASASLLNWRGAAASASIGGGGPGFVADRGWFTNGWDGYLSTGWAPSDGLGNYTQNSASFGAWFRKTEAVAANAVGTGTSSYCTLIPRNAANVMAGRINAATAGVGTTTQSSGFGLFALNRADSAGFTMWRHGVQIDGSFAGTSTALTGTTFTLGRANGVFAENQLCAFFAGASLSPAEHQALNAALGSYLTAIGCTELPAATARTLAIQASFNLPDTTGYPDNGGAIANKGFTCTGLAKDPRDGSYWISDFGAATSSNLSNPQGAIVHLSADKTAILSRQRIVQDFGFATPVRLQGLAFDATDHSLWVVANPLSGNAVILHLDPATATLIGSFAWATSTANSISVDSTRGLLIIGDQGSKRLDWYSKAGVAATPMRRFALAASIDQTHYDAASDTLFGSYGSNGADCFIVRIPLSGDYGGPRIAKTYTLAGSQAIEGIAFTGPDAFEVANDGNYHLVTRAQIAVHA